MFTNYKSIMVRLIVMIGIGLVSLNAVSQDLEKRNLYYGNRAFDEGDFDEAIGYYEEAVNASPLSFKPNYNMANAYFRKNDFEKAANLYGSIIDLAPTAYDRALVYHNLGNSYFMNQKLDDAIDAYKAALKLNPKDEDSRYNLAYAQLLKKQQQQNQDKNENQDKNQDQNENENEGDNQNESDQNGNQNNEGDQQNDKEEDSGSDKDDKQDGTNDSKKQPIQPKISKEQAKRILEAALKSEKDTRKKMEKNKVVGTGESKKKDW